MARPIVVLAALVFVVSQAPEPPGLPRPDAPLLIPGARHRLHGRL